MAEPLLEARGVTKRFGQVLALDSADFAVYPGEIVALIGDNGAGKSTLVKTLSGTLRPDGGEILVSGKAVHFSSPLDARRYGIETVYQDLALAPDLDAAANLHLGREIYLIPFLKVLDRRTMRHRATAAFKDLGVELPDMAAPVASLSGGQRQSVAVARAVAFASQVIFMDEPTAALGVVQRGRVLETMRRVRGRGISIVLISHNMPEVLAVADRVEVLRLGRRVARFRAADTSVEELVGAMTGALEANGGGLHGAGTAGAAGGADKEQNGQGGATAGPPGSGNAGGGAGGSAGDPGSPADTAGRGEEERG